MEAIAFLMMSHMLEPAALAALDAFALSDAAEHVVLPFQPFPDRESMAIGYAGVYRGRRLGRLTFTPRV